MFHLVTGSYPVQGQTVAEIRAAHREGRRLRLRDARPGLSARFIAAVEGALELDPARRFGAARDLEAALKPRHRGAGRPFWAAAAAVTVALATAVLVVPGPWRVPVKDGASVVARQVPLSDWMEDGGPSKDGRLFSFVDSAANIAVLDLASNQTRRLTEDASPEGDGQYASPVISADGRFVAAMWWGKDGQAALRVVEVESKQVREVKVNDGGLSSLLEWSRDGAFIVSIVTRPDYSNQLALVSVEDGGIQVVKDLGPVRPQNVSLSPDGEFLVYDYPQLRNASARDVFIIRRDGSDERRLVEFPATDVAPVWTSSGDRVVFASDRSGAMDLWSVEVRGGVVQGEPSVLHRNIGRMLPLGITDKGAYYYHQTLGAVDVYDAPLEGETSREAKLISTTYSGSNISSLWSPDGRRIALASRRGPVGFARGWTTLVIRDLQTQEQREVTPAMNSFLLRSWSPDGENVLVQGQDAQGRTGAHAIHVETGRVSSIVLNPAGQNDIKRPDWKPDGLVVYLNSGSQKLLAREPSTGQEHVLVDLKAEGLKLIGNFMGRGFKLSPDGKALAYTVNGRAGTTQTASVWIRPLGGGASQELARAAAPETLMFQDWTPDGGAVLFTRWDSKSPKEVSLWRVSTGGGEPESLGLAREALRDVSVNPSGSRITFTAGNPRAEIWALENLLRPQPKP
jgi:Tol biopolymer transport system component